MDAKKVNAQLLQMPKLLYGTAWKKERTKDLVYLALSCGFRGIDTACQPRHYNEKLVGDAINQYIREGKAKREDLFIQTKYTSEDGQDQDTIPYDSSLSIKEQVRSSFEVSKKNLGASYIDSYVLHSPMRTVKETLEAWSAMEELYHSGQIRQLGISNIYDYELLLNLWSRVDVKPAVIQNRFDSHHNNFDEQIREFCRHHGLVYQSFWTLTASSQRMLLASQDFIKLANSSHLTPAQLLLKVVMNLGIVPLVGSTSKEHLLQDQDLLKTEIPQKHQNAVLSSLGIRS
jgi:diketogulonate reductase-like aldo/keto reductase